MLVRFPPFVVAALITFSTVAVVSAFVPLSKQQQQHNPFYHLKSDSTMSTPSSSSLQVAKDAPLFGTYVRAKMM
jgi:hypothetical protein